MSPTIEEMYRQHRRAVEFVNTLNKVFVLGSAKSGTTWVMQMLNGHPEMVVNGEGGFAWLVAPTIDQTLQSIDKHRAQHANDKPVVAFAPLDRLLAIRSILDGRLAKYIQSSQDDLSNLKYVGDKTPQHAVRISMLRQIYPDAKFIHVIRDPRDVATSAWFHIGRSDHRSKDELIRHFMNEVWPLNVGTARREGPQAPEQYIEVRYEDLLDRESSEVQRLLSFLDVDCSANMAQACIEAGSFQKASGGRSRGEADESSFYRKGTAGDWVNHIEPELAHACCQPIADLMREVGYDPNAMPTAVTGAS